MLPDFFVEEATVRECGESAVIPIGEHSDQNLFLTLGITHAMERESLDVDIYTFRERKSWADKPVVSFVQKSYCGTYQMILPRSRERFLKAVWRVSRWGQSVSHPFFRFYVFAQSTPVRARALSRLSLVDASRKLTPPQSGWL
jgi:hypothetical protein